MSKGNPKVGDTHRDDCPCCRCDVEFEVKEIDNEGAPVVECQSCHKLFAVIGYHKTDNSGGRE